MAARLGRVLLIANPAAQSGKGDAAADEAARLLRASLGADAVVLAKTAGPRHASEIAERATGCDTVVALGGDGVIHEVANGLMRRPETDRPQLGVIPVGSGNDYARTLGMASNLERACEQLLEADAIAADVGRANDQWFVETLSFGLDAAIALDTMERRKRTGRAGTLLYAEAGLYQLTHHLDTYNYDVSFDGAPVEAGQSITFAVQLGPYYGGGFKICPDASLTDGSFDVCVAHPPVSLPKALHIFARAKSGGHTKFKQIDIRRCNALHVEFTQAPPAQVDGERIEGRTFDISLHPAALQVLRPRA